MDLLGSCRKDNEHKPFTHIHKNTAIQSDNTRNILRIKRNFFE